MVALANTLTTTRPRLVCSWCNPGDRSSDASHGCCAGHYAEMMRHMGVPEEQWRVVVRQHPSGGYTLAVLADELAKERGETPAVTGSARVYCGWWSTQGEARRAML